MATGAENVAAAWDQVNQATNDLAARVQALIDDINRTATEGLNGPQTEAVLANLTGLAATLSAMGVNPGNPLPPAGAKATAMPGPFNTGTHPNPGTGTTPSNPTGPGGNLI